MGKWKNKNVMQLVAATKAIHRQLRSAEGGEGNDGNVGEEKVDVERG